MSMSITALTFFDTRPMQAQWQHIALSAPMLLHCSQLMSNAGTAV